MKKLVLNIFLLMIPLLGFGQYNQYFKEDSVKAKYPYTFPIFGNFLHDIGIDLPYPVGIMVNYYHGVQGVLIPEIAVGFSGIGQNDIPLTDISRLIDFGEINATVSTINVRPDIWVLPFLDVYGIFGKTWTTTDVQITYPFEMNAVAELDGVSYGIGMTFAGGFSHYFGVIDMNNVWTKMSNFEDPVKSGVLSMRLGRTIKLRNKPEANIGFWIGAMNVNLGGITEGSLTLSEVLPQDVWDRKDEIVSDYYEKYDTWDEMQQEAADKILTPIVEKIEEGDGSGTVHYSLAKASEEPWNMLVGGQYQFDKHFQFRTEFGFLGARTSMLFSLNYRFGIKHKE